MSYFEKYKKRVRSYGNSTSESFEIATKEIVNNSFEDSPTYREVTIGNETFGIRLVNEDKIDEKSILFRPNTDNVSIGSYVKIGDIDWLIVEFDKDRMTPKSLIKKADKTIRWKKEDGSIVEEPCVLESVFYEEVRDGKYFFSPKGNIRIYTQFNDNTSKIISEYRFIFGSSVYKVGGVDDFSNIENGVGFLVINLEKTEKSTADDFVNGVADNSSTITQESGNGGGWL